MINKGGQDLITAEDYAPLRRAHSAAVKAGLDVFKYQGRDMVTQYAKYLLEYLESQLGKKN